MVNGILCCGAPMEASEGTWPRNPAVDSSERRERRERRESTEERERVERKGGGRAGGPRDLKRLVEELQVIWDFGYTGLPGVDPAGCPLDLRFSPTLPSSPHSEPAPGPLHLAVCFEGVHRSPSASGEP